MAVCIRIRQWPVVQEDSNGAERPVYRQKRPKKRKSPLQIPFPEGGTTLCFRSKDKIKGISLCRQTVYFIQNHILKNKKSSLLFSWTTDKLNQLKFISDLKTISYKFHL